MGREIKRAMDHWVFEGKSNIAVIYRRESLRVGQSLSKNSGAQPVNRVWEEHHCHLQDGCFLFPNTQQLFWEQFLVYTVQTKAFCQCQPKLYFQLLLMLCGGHFGPMLPSFWIWHLELPMQEHLINIICSANFNLRLKNPVNHSGPLQCSNIS